MKYRKCCICEKEIVASDGFSSLVSGRVHITCSNGAVNYVLELARINGAELSHPFLGPGMVNHFRDNLEALSNERKYA